MGLELTRELPEREQNGMHCIVDLTDGKNLQWLALWTECLRGHRLRVIWLRLLTKKNFFFDSLSSIRILLCNPLGI